MAHYGESQCRGRDAITALDIRHVYFINTDSFFFF